MDGELSLAEAAERFGIEPATIRKAVQRGRIPARRIGPIHVVTATAVGEWIAHGRHTAGRPRKDGRPASGPRMTPTGASASTKTGPGTPAEKRSPSGPRAAGKRTARSRKQPPPNARRTPWYLPTGRTDVAPEYLPPGDPTLKPVPIPPARQTPNKRRG